MMNGRSIAISRHRPRIAAMIVVTLAAIPAAAHAGEIATISDLIGDDLWRVLSLRDYNTRVVVLGTTLLGLTSGVIGSFMLLRKRALMGDALSHATLPGIGIAFMVMTAWGWSGKSMPGLLLGAACSASVGAGLVLVIRRFTRLKEDAALGIVLSVFFGLGVALLGVIQKMQTGHAAGLESFIYGKTASMLASDAQLILIAGVVTAIGCALFFKEFGLVCFDPEYAGAQGFPVVLLDVLMLSMVILVTVIGLQAVGLILMIALLVIPAAAARFWTNHLRAMVVIAAIIGALSGFIGAECSALVRRLPAGAIIVVVATLVFVFSMTFGTERGVLRRWLETRQLLRSTSRQHLLRALFEWFESKRGSDGMPLAKLLAARSWSSIRLRRTLNHAAGDGLIRLGEQGQCFLTEAGQVEARRIVRNHRLWELYLITHADIAPSHVDRDADQLEHVLGATMVEKLESILATDYPHLAVPPSPHRIGESAVIRSSGALS